MTYLKALLLFELYAHENDDATSLTRVVHVILLIFVHYHVVQINALADRLYSHVIAYPAVYGIIRLNTDVRYNTVRDGIVGYIDV